MAKGLPARQNRRSRIGKTRVALKMAFLLAVGQDLALLEWIILYHIVLYCIILYYDLSYIYTLHYHNCDIVQGDINCSSLPSGLGGNGEFERKYFRMKSAWEEAPQLMSRWCSDLWVCKDDGDSDTDDNDSGFDLARVWKVKWNLPNSRHLEAKLSERNSPSEERTLEFDRELRHYLLLHCQTHIYHASPFWQNMIVAINFLKTIMLQSESAFSSSDHLDWNTWFWLWAVEGAR